MSAPTTAPRTEARDWKLTDAHHELMLVQLERVRGPGPWKRAWQRFRRMRLAWFSAVALTLFSALSALAPLLPLPSPVAMRVGKASQAPKWPWVELVNQDFERDYWRLDPVDELLVDVRSSAFDKMQTGPWLGTDALGRDVLSRLLWGSRTSLLVGLAAALTSLLIGLTWGAFSGLIGGKFDELAMRVVDALQALPTIFVVIFVLSLMSAPRSSTASAPWLSREQVFFLVIGAVSWLPMARIVRGQVLVLSRAPFVEAARVAGASTPRIVWTHVVPNVLSVAVVQLTLTIPAVILYESFLSFLGLGVEAPRVSWGVLASEGIEALQPLRIAWWLIAAPAVAMGGTLLLLGFVGDGVRDALDTKRAEPAP